MPANRDADKTKSDVTDTLEPGCCKMRDCPCPRVLEMFLRSRCTVPSKAGPPPNAFWSADCCPPRAARQCIFPGLFCCRTGPGKNGTHETHLLYTLSKYDCGFNSGLKKPPMPVLLNDKTEALLNSIHPKKCWNLLHLADIFLPWNVISRNITNFFYLLLYRIPICSLSFLTIISIQMPISIAEFFSLERSKWLSLVWGIKIGNAPTRPWNAVDACNVLCTQWSLVTSKEFQW